MTSIMVKYISLKKIKNQPSSDGKPIGYYFIEPQKF